MSYVTAKFGSAVENELISEAFISVTGAAVADVTLTDGTKGNAETGFAVELNDAKTIFNISSNAGVETATVKIILDVAAADSYEISLVDVTSATDSQQLIKFPTQKATVVISAPHVHTEEEIPAVPAKCTTTGLTAGVKCSECDEVLTAPTEVPALGHAWVDGDITYTDCTSNGNLAQACSRCDATQTVAVDPKGHTPVAYEDVAATCTTVGYTGGTYCSECDAVIEARTEIPATGHNFGDNLEFCANNCGTANPDYVAPVVCDHANKTLVAATPASSGIVGKLDYDCPDCDDDDVIDITVEYSMYSAMQTPDIEWKTRNLPPSL